MKSKPGRRISDLSPQFATVVGASAVFIGKIAGEGNFEIYGSVEGDSDIKGTLVLHESGYWKGNVLAKNAVIAGIVDGDIMAKEKLELTSTAQIKGNVVGGIVAIAEGAVFDGEIHITKKEHIKFFKENRNGIFEEAKKVEEPMKAEK